MYGSSQFNINSSVRATNVYEEKSLGVYDPEEDVTEPVDDKSKAVEYRVAIWGKYLMRHVRRQLSFGPWSSFCVFRLYVHTGLSDMWWLAVSLFLVCIVEVSVTPPPGLQICSCSYSATKL